METKVLHNKFKYILEGLAPAGKEEEGHLYIEVDGLTYDVTAKPDIYHVMAYDRPRNTITVDTWLPVFPGFYGTIFDHGEAIDIERENIEQDRKDKGLSPPLTQKEIESIDFDINSRMNDIAAKCCGIMEMELSGFVHSIEFQGVHSPRSYNFTNDQINCRITFDMQAARKYITDDIEAFKAHLKERYTSRDGFIPLQSSDAKDWQFYDVLRDEHKAGEVLQFICNQQGITDEDLQEASMMYISANNYDYEKHEIIINNK